MTDSARVHPPAFTTFTGVLDDELWLRDLMHPTQDLVLSRMFAMVAPAVLSLRLVRDDEVGLHPRWAHRPDTTVRTARVWFFAAACLGVMRPRLFIRTDMEGGVVSLPTWPPATLMGSSLLHGYRMEELLFAAGHHLSAHRGEHWLRTLLVTDTEWEQVLDATLRIARVTGARSVEVEDMADRLVARMRPAEHEALLQLGERFRRGAVRADVRAWRRAAELTACRAGFLLSGDLEASATMIERLAVSCKDARDGSASATSCPARRVDADTPKYFGGALSVLGAASRRRGARRNQRRTRDALDPSAREKVADLVAFAGSPEHRRLRQALGGA